MKIHTTLEEILNRCNNWDDFCEDKGYDNYAVNEGAGHIQVSLTESEAKKYGII